MRNGEIVERMHIEHIFHNRLILSMHTVIASANGPASSAHAQDRNDFTHHPLTAFVRVVEPFPDDTLRSIVVTFKDKMCLIRCDDYMARVHEFLVARVQIHAQSSNLAKMLIPLDTFI